MSDRSFEIYYKEFKDKVYTHVYYRVGTNKDTAADVTSEVFLRAYKNFSSYKKKYAFSTWIFTITRNAIIDHYRKKKDVIDINDCVDILEDDTMDIQEVLDQQFDLNWLNQEVGKLPKKQKLYLSHRLFDGRTVSQIAKDYEVKEDAVRKNIQRATKTLIQAYKNCHAR